MLSTKTQQRRREVQHQLIKPLTKKQSTCKGNYPTLKPTNKGCRDLAMDTVPETLTSTMARRGEIYGTTAQAYDTRQIDGLLVGRACCTCTEHNYVLTQSFSFSPHPNTSIKSEIRRSSPTKPVKSSEDLGNPGCIVTTSFRRTICGRDPAKVDCTSTTDDRRRPREVGRHFPTSGRTRNRRRSVIQVPTTAVSTEIGRLAFSNHLF